VQQDSHAFDDPDRPAPEISRSLDFVARAIWRAARIQALTGTDPVVLRAQEWIRWRQKFENRPWLRRARVGLERAAPKRPLGQADIQRHNTIIGLLAAGKPRSAIQRMFGRSRQAFHKELIRLGIVRTQEKRQPKPSK